MADRHALVFGASSGIGQAVSRRLLERGYRVSAFARRAERLEVLSRAGAAAFPVDVTQWDALTQSVQEAVQQGGQAQAFVYCAGMQLVKPMRLASADDVRSLIEINLTIPLLLSSLFASKKTTSTDAVFCAISSVAASRPEAGIVAYSASKAGLDGLVRGLAREVGPRRVVGIAPGWLDTEMTQRYSHIYGEGFREQLAKSSPTGPATVENVVDCAEFLLSDAAAAITGEIIRVDGGAAA